jgi:hypothetical protein
MVAK